MTYDLLAFLLLSLALIVFGSIILERLGLTALPILIVTALSLRILGSTLRFEVLANYYGGVGDANMYFSEGLLLAQYVWELDFAGLAEELSGLRRWWGTSFVVALSGLVVSVVGPSMRAGFLACSIISFVGLCCLAIAYRRSSPIGLGARNYAALLWLLPSLWFWPSSLGKEAWIVLAVGISTLGYVGRRSRPNWALFSFGVVLAFAIRPHVAAVIALSTGVAHWLSTWERLTARKAAESLVMAGVGLATVIFMSQQFGIADLEDMAQFQAERASLTLRGGSNVGITTGPLSIPMAFVNVWMRPFPWEAHNATSLVASLEIGLIWLFVARYRKSLFAALKHWRFSPVLRFAVPFALVYTLMIGLTFGNLGIISRQRIPILPFIGMLLLAAPLIERQHRRSARYEPSSAPGPNPRVAPQRRFAGHE